MTDTTQRRNPLVRAALAWNDFWFAPADPTTLGAIRLLAGFLVLYAHLAYSYDLQEFFGRDAWLSLAGADRQRHETPRSMPPTGWEPQQGTVPLPGDRDGRALVLNYFARLSAAPAARDRVLALLTQPVLPEDAAAWGDFPPPSVLLYLPADPPESELPPDDPNYVTPRGRGKVAQFIRGLPADDERRAAVLDYLKEWGVDPRQVDVGANVWSVWYHVTDPGWMVAVHCLILLIMLLFAVGFCTRVTSVLTWLAALSYIQRAPNIFYGADAMMMVMLLYLAIAPSGAALSVDRLIARWWAERKARREGRPAPVQGPPAPMVSANFALRLVQIQFCIIYLAAGTSKLLGGRWWNGHALYYTMANYEFSPLRHEYYHSLLSAVCEHRWLWELLMTGGSWFTIALELSLPMLVWNRRLRMPLVLCSVLLHTAIAVSMGLVVFSLLMATMVISFVPGERMRQWLERWLPRRWRTTGPAPKEPAQSVEEAEEPVARPKKEGRAKHGSRR